MKNKHHIIPKSRLQGNLIQIPLIDHANYHLLFSNLTPTEIIEWLAEYYWGGQWTFVYEALNEHEKRGS